MRLSRLFSLILALIAGTASAEAKTFVYTNNNVDNANTVSAFQLAGDGTLEPIPGSPFLTGNHGSGQYAAGYDALACVTGRFLYVQNTSTISGFKIASDGSLTRTAARPVHLPSKVSNLIATPDGKYLLAGVIRASTSGLTIAVFRIRRSGKLQEVAGSPFPIQAAGGQISDVRAVRVSPDGQFVAGVSSRGEVVVLRIEPNGSLVPLPGSPFPAGEFSNGMDLTFNRAGTRLYVSYQGSYPVLDVFDVSSAGELSLHTGTSFRFPGAGGDSSALALSPDGKFLFVGDPALAAINVFALDSDGLPAHLDGAPFDNYGGGQGAPYNIKVDASCRFLLVANFRLSTVGSFKIAPDGRLTLVAGCPFSTGANGQGLGSIAIYETP